MSKIYGEPDSEGSLKTRLAKIIAGIYWEWRPWILGLWLFIAFCWTYLFVRDLPGMIRLEHERIVLEAAAGTTATDEPNFKETMKKLTVSPIADRLTKDLEYISLLIFFGFVLAALPWESHRRKIPEAIPIDDP